MRQTKGYDKDFTDGTLKEHIKMKPDVEIKGVVTLQLFDKKGNLERELKTENRISDSIAKMAFMDYYCCRIRGNPWGVQWEYNEAEVGSTSTAKDQNYAEQNGAYSYFTAPFRHLILTDDTSEEAGFARSIKGNIIGWADKSRAYAGVSTIKGSVNLSETVFSESNLHFVFDFPTSVANGTFQKIWWCDMKYDSSTQEVFYGLKELSRSYKLDSYTNYLKSLPSPSNFTPGVYSTYNKYRVFKYNQNLYVIGPSKSTGKLCMAVLDINSEYYYEVDLYTTMELNSANNFRTADYLTAQENNHVYFIYPNSNNILHRLNLDDYSRVEIALNNNYHNLIGQQIPEIPSGWYVNIDSTYIKSSLMGCKNGKLYIPIRYVNGATNKTFIIVCNPDANLTATALYDLSTVNSPAGPFAVNAMSLSGYDLRLQVRDADTWFVCNGNYTFVTDNNFNIIDICYRNYNFDSQSVLEDTAGSAVKKYYINNSSNIISQWGLNWSLWEPIAAMTLLPSPVTKTPTNTMKIQYDFNIQKVDPFQP